MAAIEKRSREAWQELDKDHHLHPFTDHKSLHEKRSRIIARAEGVYIYDADDNKILDGMSGLWCVNAGYGRQELVRRSARLSSTACFSPAPDPSRMTPSCAWSGPIGT